MRVRCAVLRMVLVAAMVATCADAAGNVCEARATTSISGTRPADYNAIPQAATLANQSVIIVYEYEDTSTSKFSLVLLRFDPNVQKSVFVGTILTSGDSIDPGGGGGRFFVCGVNFSGYAIAYVTTAQYVGETSSITVVLSWTGASTESLIFRDTGIEDVFITGLDSGAVAIVWIVEKISRMCIVPFQARQCGPITTVTQLQGSLTDLQLVATDNGGFVVSFLINGRNVTMLAYSSNGTLQYNISATSDLSVVPIVRVAGGWGAVLATGTTVRWWAFNYTLNTTSDSPIASLPTLPLDAAAVSLYHSEVILAPWKNASGIYGFAFSPTRIGAYPTSVVTIATVGSTSSYSVAALAFNDSAVVHVFAKEVDREITFDLYAVVMLCLPTNNWPTNPPTASSATATPPNVSTTQPAATTKPPQRRTRTNTTTVATSATIPLLRTRSYSKSASAVASRSAAPPLTSSATVSHTRTLPYVPPLKAVPEAQRAATATVATSAVVVSTTAGGAAGGLELQGALVLGSMECTSAEAQEMTEGSHTAIAPVHTAGRPLVGAAGNVGIAAGVFVLQLVAVGVTMAARRASWEEACALCRFPGLSYRVFVLAYQGLTLESLDGLLNADKSTDSAPMTYAVCGACAAVAVLVPLSAIVRAHIMCNTAGAKPLVYTAYASALAPYPSAVRGVLLPHGFWDHRDSRYGRYGSLVDAVCGPSRVFPFVLQPFLMPLVSAVLISLRSVNCNLRIAILAAAHATHAAMILLLRPYRVGLARVSVASMNLLTVLLAVSLVVPALSHAAASAMSVMSIVSLCLVLCRLVVGILERRWRRFEENCTSAANALMMPMVEVGSAPRGSSFSNPLDAASNAFLPVL